MLRKSLIYAVIFILFVPVNINAQEDNGTILLIVNADAEVLIDGESHGSIRMQIPKKFEISSGEHYIQALDSLNSMNKGEIVVVESGVQKIIKLEFDIVEKEKAINVVNDKFSIDGLVTAGAWMSENPNQEYPNYPKYYYAFEQGDEVIINCPKANDKGTNLMIIKDITNNLVLYSNEAFTVIKDLKLKVEGRAIYEFSFATNHVLNRNCILKVDRIPESSLTANFITTVKWEVEYSTSVIIDKQRNYINGGSKATLMDGKSRILIPINLPPNTVKWYYSISSSREESEIVSFTETMDLVGELIGQLDATGGLLAFGIGQLTQPPGADYCDVILLDSPNAFLFRNKEGYDYYPEGTRQNIKSGTVEIKDCISGSYYLGLRNPDTFYGVNTILDVVAITYSERLASIEN